MPPHAIDQLFFYALTPEAEPRDMYARAHRRFRARRSGRLDGGDGGARVADVRSQLCRAAAHARPAARPARRASSTPSRCYPNDPLVVDSLAPLSRGARRFLTWIRRQPSGSASPAIRRSAGAGSWRRALGEELARRGHEVHFISYERPFRLPAECAAPAFPSGGHQRLRAVQVSRTTRCRSR